MSPKTARPAPVPSGVTDTAWARIARFLVPKHPEGGRPCPPQRWREYLDAMLYVLRTDARGDTCPTTSPSPGRPRTRVSCAGGPTAAKAGVTVDVLSGPKPGNGFIVQPRRWVVERTDGWINHCRRIDRNYDTTLTTHEGFVYLSQIALLLR